MIDTKKYSDWLIRKQAERDRVVAELEKVKKDTQTTAARRTRTERARAIVNEVLMITQEKVKGYIEEVVSLALSSVYGGGYGFELEFTIKRNKSEATPWIIKDNDRFSPRDEVGGGVLDIVSLALRLSLWSLMEPRPAPVFILDEPGRFLSRSKQGQFGQMLREVSEKLGIQIVAVTHSQDLAELADRSYRVEQVSGVSSVKEVE